jgi:hypothetical protein
MISETLHRTITKSVGSLLFVLRRLGGIEHARYSSRQPSWWRDFGVGDRSVGFENACPAKSTTSPLTHIAKSPASLVRSDRKFRFVLGLRRLDFFRKSLETDDLFASVSSLSLLNGSVEQKYAV